jgi:hypothetical protein
MIEGITILLTIYALLIGTSLMIRPSLAIHLIARSGSKEAWEMRSSLQSKKKQQQYRMLGAVITIVDVVFILTIVRPFGS